MLKTLFTNVSDFSSPGILIAIRTTSVLSYCTFFSRPSIKRLSESRQFFTFYLRFLSLKDLVMSNLHLLLKLNQPFNKMEGNLMEGN